MKEPQRPQEPPTPCLDRNDPEAWSFRSTADLSKLAATVNTCGLGELRLSGSASFSSEAQITHLSRHWHGSFHVIDLRQEPHAIVDGYSVGWIAGKNWANVGKPREEVLDDEQKLIAEFRREARTLPSYEDLEKGRPDPLTLTLDGGSVRDEANLVRGAGGKYTRLTVSDHLRPRDEDVDLFITTVRELEPNVGLHVHCKGGMGRTMTHMAMYDMLHNAERVSVGHILARQTALHGSYDLAKPGRHASTSEYHEDRLAFLKEFHEFSKANPKGRPQTWSEWLVQTELAEVPPACPRLNSVA